jgi:hypothetical protein
MACTSVRSWNSMLSTALRTPRSRPSARLAIGSAQVVLEVLVQPARREPEVRRADEDAAPVGEQREKREKIG